MHDITFIRENPDLFDELLKKRFIDPKSNEIISLDKKKRDILTKSQELRAERKNLSSSFANLNDSDKADLQKKVQLIKNKIDELENDISIIDEQLKNNLSISSLLGKLIHLNVFFLNQDNQLLLQYLRRLQSGRFLFFLRRQLNLKLYQHQVAPYYFYMPQK